MLRKSVLGEGKEKPRAKAPEERHTCFILGTGDLVAERKGYGGRGRGGGETAAEEIKEIPMAQTK